MAEATEFCKVMVTDICGHSLWNLLHVTFVVHSFEVKGKANPITGLDKP
jgi:hypothetical protein